MIIAVLFILLFQYVSNDDHQHSAFNTTSQSASFKNYHIRVKQPISCEKSIQVRLKKKKKFPLSLKFDSILVILIISLPMNMYFLYFWNQDSHQKLTQLFFL